MSEDLCFFLDNFQIAVVTLPISNEVVIREAYYRLKTTSFYPMWCWG